MRLALILLTALATGCGSRQLKVESVPEPTTLCPPELVLQHVVDTTGCTAPVIYEDDQAPFPVYYGVCEDSGDLIVTSMVVPTSVYPLFQADIEADGGEVICQDQYVTVIDVIDVLGP